LYPVGVISPTISFYDNKSMHELGALFSPSLYPQGRGGMERFPLGGEE